MPDTKTLDLSDIHKTTALIYSVGRSTISVNAHCGIKAAAKLGTWPFRFTSAYWCSALTCGIREAINVGCKYVVTYDGDSVFDWRHIAYLWTLMEINPDADAIAALQVKRQSNAMLWDIRPAGANPEEKIDLEIRDLMPATLGHFGLTIIRADALKAVPQPWFLRLSDPKRPGESVDEDVYFWKQWTANGRSLFIATRCPIGHLDEVIVYPGEDFSAINQNIGEYHQTESAPKTARKTSWEMAELEKASSKFTSQYGEDRWILENLVLPDKGIFVDVGAFDGVTRSNTLALESRGWSGVLIEPNPTQVVKCRFARKAPVEECAIAKISGTRPLHLSSDPELAGLMPERGGAQISVSARPLSDVLFSRNIQAIDVLSIDVEGTELEAWDSFDHQTIRPRVVIVEWNTLGLPDRSTEIIDRLTSDGYRLAHRTAGNLIFALPETFRQAAA